MYHEMVSQGFDAYAPVLCRLDCMNVKQYVGDLIQHALLCHSHKHTHGMWKYVARTECKHKTELSNIGSGPNTNFIAKKKKHLGALFLIFSRAGTVLYLKTISLNERKMCFVFKHIEIRSRAIMFVRQHSDNPVETHEYSSSLNSPRYAFTPTALYRYLQP